MGNLTNAMTNQGQDAGADGESHRRRWSGTSTTWENFQERRFAYDNENDDPPNHEMELNGMTFSGICVPENVLELILSLVSPNDVRKCNQVCRAWKDITTRKSYWKKWFKRFQINWNLIPEHVREKPESWIVFHAEILHKICTRNFIDNHSGAAEFDGWQRFKNGGNGWTIENPLQGCEPLPRDPFFEDSESAFVTSFQTCSQWTLIDLWENGLTPPVMKTCLPFELVCSQMYTVRFDCGGIFIWTLRVLDTKKETIMDYTHQFNLPSGSSWQRTEHAFEFKEEHGDKLEDVRYLAFIQDGRDNQFWAGHYGPKFSRSSVQLRLLGRNP